MEGQKNIFEDVVEDVIKRTLSLRFDICRCDICRKSMLEIVLSKLPKFFINTNQFKYQDIVNYVRNRYFKKIMEETAAAINYVSKNPPHKTDTNREKDFKQLLERIYQDRGLDFRRYHQSILKRRVALRLRENNKDSYLEYLKILAHNPDEYEKLFDVLTINVSEFFRDKPVWEDIRKVLNRVIADDKYGTRVKIWSAGCAKGEEPYSLAILAEEIGCGKRVEVYATDIDNGSLTEAREGIYDVRRVRNVPDNILKKYFDFDGHGNYVLKDFIKKKVIFKKHDLINDFPLPETNIVVCRNVFIYFTKPLQETILNKFYTSLKNGGYLIIGKAETILTEARLIFENFDTDNRIYRKKKI